MVLTLARFTLLGRPSQPKALPPTVVPRASFPFSKARKDFILIADVQFVPLESPVKRPPFSDVKTFETLLSKLYFPASYLHLMKL